MGRKKINVIDKFWAKVDRRNDDECWPWLGAPDKDGYGQIWDGNVGKMKRAHRISAELHYGKSQGQIVIHSCDNPSCCNPAHLSYGTTLENQKDKVAKNRHAKGENQGHSKLTEAQVEDIRRRASEGYRALCAEFKLAPSTVYRIWHGQAWKHSLAR
ncbi:MAG: hypothetical protein EBR90_01040 [Actinobacteria bacterium]|nr:hypothetical protein [Actinomycetota bacterium]